MNRIILLAFVLSAASLASPLAQANKVEKLSIKAPDDFGDAPTVVVYSSQGDKWDKVDKTAGTKFRIGLNAKCKYEGRGNKAYRGSLSVAGFTLIGSHEPPDFLIPDSNDASGTFRYDNGNGQPTSALKVCADELGKRLSANADLSKYDVLAKGLTVNYPAAFKVSFGLTCKPTGAGFSDYASKSVMVNARIQCAASALAKEKIPKPALKPKRAVLAPLIKQVTFTANPPEYTGECPTGISFNGEITATRAGTVRYRYVSHDGKKSPDFSLEFASAGTRATRKWHRTLSKPDPGKTLSAGARTSKWDHTGWYRIEILSPQGQNSVKAAYKVDCTVPSKARAVKIKDIGSE